VQNKSTKGWIENMTEESQQGSLQHETPTIAQPQTSDSTSPQSQKSKKKTRLIVGIVLVVLCLCSIVCVAVIGTGMYKVFLEKAPVESVLDTYMQLMANKDADSAYALFSPRAQRQISISEIQDMLDGNNYFIFEDYQNLSVSNLNISAVVNTNPDVPQGTVATVTGVITYEGGFQGSFNGTLEKVDGNWMIDGFYVNIPPDKIK
jgi:hypothetical protein